jgi:hypothetical protein
VSDPVQRTYPRYGGGSILNLASAVAGHFGVETGYPPLEGLDLSGSRRVVLFVVDALGYRQLERHLEAGDAPHLYGLLEREEVELSRATSVFPSTTAAALTTLHTAAPPAETGMLGYNLWLPEVGAVSDMISFRDLERRSPIPLPHRLAKTPSIYSRLSRAGVACRTVNCAEFEDTPLTRWHFAGAEYVPYASLEEMPRLVAEAAGPGYTVTYWPGYDTACHLHGPRSHRAAASVRRADAALARLFRNLTRTGDTALILTADHGQRELSPRKAALLNDDPYLTPRIKAPPGGERACRYFYAANGSERELALHLRGAADTLPTAEAWDSGLFGGPPAQEDYRERTGDILAVTRSAWQLNWAFSPEQRRDFHRGGHGGWTEEEMLVPVLFARL